MPGGDGYDYTLGILEAAGRQQEVTRACSGAGHTSETEAYRFLWPRTFHNPIAVRVFDADRIIASKLWSWTAPAGTSREGLSSRHEGSPRDQWRTVIARLEK